MTQAILILFAFVITSCADAGKEKFANNVSSSTNQNEARGVTGEKGEKWYRT